MYRISITPRFRPRRPYAVWEKEFETVPAKTVLRRALQADAEAMEAGLADGTIESTEENLFISKAVHPKCFLVLDAARKLPQPKENCVRIRTIVASEKILGSIAIVELGDTNEIDG